MKDEGNTFYFIVILDTPWHELYVPRFTFAVLEMINASIAIPAIAAQSGDGFYLGLAMAFIFGLAGITTWILGKFFIK